MLVHHQFRWLHLQKLYLAGGEGLEMVLLRRPFTNCAELETDLPRGALAHSGL